MDQICYACHTDAEGKFLKTYTHKPVTDAQCDACHLSHGANEKNLLRLPGSKMCAQCHGDLMKADASGTRHNPFEEGECLTCHDAHGSSIKGMTLNKQGPLCFSCHPDLEKGVAGSKSLNTSRYPRQSARSATTPTKQN